MGFKLSRERVSLVAEKIEAIRKLLRPNNKTELRAFLGAIIFMSDSNQICTDTVLSYTNYPEKTSHGNGGKNIRPCLRRLS